MLSNFDLVSLWAILLFSGYCINYMKQLNITWILCIFDTLHDFISFVNLKNVKNAHGGKLLLVKLQDSAFTKSNTLLKVTLLHGCFSRFLNCINGTKSPKSITFDKKIIYFVLSYYLSLTTRSWFLNNFSISKTFPLS